MSEDKNKLEDLTVAELQEKLIALGMPEDDVKAFKTRQPLIASINAISAKNAEVEEVKQEAAAGDTDSNEIEEVKKQGEEVKVKSINERPNPSEERLINKQWKTKAEIMKRKLLGQEFVSIIVPLETGEKTGVVIWVDSKSDAHIPNSEWATMTPEARMYTHQVHVEGAVVSPQLNGFKYFIPKGIYYKVPLQIAQVVTNSQQQTMDAGKHIDLDRTDPRTGRPIKESL